LIHDKLSVALSKAQSLSKLEWKEMHIRGLRIGHFVRDQGGFFYAPGEVASNNTLSGGVAPDQGEQIEIEIEPRRGPVQNKARRKAVRKERRERQRRVVMRAVYEGLEPDDAGRWAIQRILQVERPATSRRGRTLQVLVQWIGDDEDGNPWQDSWVGISMLTADQRAEARRLEKTRYAPEDLGKRARKEVVAQRRAQPQDEDKKQWEVRLRNRKRAREGVCKCRMSMAEMPDIGVPPITPRFACLGLCPRHVCRCRSAAVVTYLLLLTAVCPQQERPTGDGPGSTSGSALEPRASVDS
jgi:hypothetical protein